MDQFNKIATRVLVAICIVYSFVFSWTHKYDQATFFLVLAGFMLYVYDRNVRTK